MVSVYLTKTYEKLVILRSLKNFTKNYEKTGQNCSLYEPYGVKMEAYEISDVHPTITPMSNYKLADEMFKFAPFFSSTSHLI